MYKVVKAFLDFQDDLHDYKVGDVYPRNGYTPSAFRVAELAGKNNMQHTPLIALEAKKAEPKKTRSRKAGA